MSIYDEKYTDLHVVYKLVCWMSTKDKVRNKDRDCTSVGFKGGGRLRNN